MKSWGKIVLLGAAILLMAAGLAYWLAPGGDKAVERTKRELREAGFKVDVREFDFSAPVEVQARVAALTNQWSMRRRYVVPVEARRYELGQFLPELVPMVGTNSARLLWKEERLRLSPEEGRLLEPEEKWLEDDAWPVVRVLFEEEREETEAAAKAAISGPIRFHLDASKGMGMLLPHLASLKSYAFKFARAAVIELHEGNKEAAWTNLLAASRLVTAWKTEPVEMSHMVRFACARIAFHALWQGLSAGWSEERLANLQREWQETDFLKGIPETVSFTRAAAVQTLALERAEPVEFGMSLREAVSAPRVAFGNIRYYFERLRYRRSGSFAVEREAMLHFRDREVELRKAVQAKTWEEMRGMAGVTNLVPFQSRHPSGLVSVLNLRQISLAATMFHTPGGGNSLLGRASEAEAIKSLIVTAIALERYRARHGEYAEALAKLVPEFLGKEPLDFMDGKPLRYRCERGERYVLYSVGTDGVDRGGVVPRRNDQQEWTGVGPGPAIRPASEADIIWPRVASKEELDSFWKEQFAEAAERMRNATREEAERHWTWTAERQAQVEEILSRPYERPPVLKNKGGTFLSEILNPAEKQMDRRKTLEELLTLRPIEDGESEVVKQFELGIDFDPLVKHATVGLIVDLVNNDGFEGMVMAGDFNCIRGKDGKAVITWNTVYEAPGKHVLQAGLYLNEPEDFTGDAAGVGRVLGPPLTVTVTNICQFSAQPERYHPAVGWMVRGRAEEMKARYRAKFLSRNGEHLKTIEGSTTNGIIAVEWDFVTENGERWDRTIDNVFEMTLEDSRRTQTFRHP